MKKSILSIAFLAIACSAVQAQMTETAYFTDGYLYGHELNPAKGNDRTYVAFPALGNLNVELQGNLGLRDILYNVNGRTALFTNPGVSTSKFLDNIQDRNELNADIKVQLLSVGFKAFGGYNTITINARSNTSTRIPGTLLEMAKVGLTNQTYNISDMKAHANAYAELGFGHSRQLTDKLRIGAKVKLLFGLGNIDANFKKATLTLGGDCYTAITNAEINSSVKNFKYKTKTTMRGPSGQKTAHTYVNGADIDGFGLNGFGLALDMGAEYKLTEDLTLTGSLLDLGFISYSNNVVASTNGDRTFTTSKYIFNVDDDATNSFKKEANRLTEGLSALYELQDMGDQGSRGTGLYSTMNLGAEYQIIDNKLLSVGGLLTTRFGGYGWTKFRLSVNSVPLKILSASVSTALGTYGANFGWALNLHPKGFNLFLGMDHIMGKLAKQGVPLSSNSSVNIGINFPF